MAKGGFRGMPGGMGGMSQAQMMKQAQKMQQELLRMQEEQETKTYTADVKFGLDVSTSSLNGDLIVKVMVDGEAVKTVRLAGDNEHTIFGDLVGSALGTIQPDANGVFTIEDVELADGQKFTLNLEGVQNLDKGVYLYSSEVRTDGGESTSSQTLVGVASGTRGFDVTLDLKFDLDVQDQVIVQERVWRNEYDPETTPPSPPELPNDPPVVWNRPPVTQLANDEVEIPEEPVPLAAPVTTGDTTSLWIIAMMVIVCGMVVINLFDKKRNYEAF